MQCKFCRTDIPEGATVCPICGTPVPPQEEMENPVQEQDETTNQDNMPYQNETGDGFNGGQAENSGQMKETGYSYQQDFERNYNQNTEQYNYHYNNQGNYNQNDYQQNNYQQNSYNPNGQNMKPVNGTKYMIFAILTTVLCCLPFGIVAVIYASRINSLQRIGDFAGASQAAKKAKTFSIISAVLALVVMIGYGVLFVMFPEDTDFASGVKNTDIVYPTEDEQTEEEEIEEEAPEAEVPAPINDELGKTWDSFAIQIGDSAIQFPCKVQEVEAAGFTIDDPAVTKEYVVNPDEYKSVLMKNAQGASAMFDFSNETDEVQKITECEIAGIYVDEYSVNKSGVTMAFPGGVKVGTSEEDLLKAYGEPTDSFEGENYNTYAWYTKGDYGKNCQIAIDPKTKKVKYMSMSCKDY